MTPDDETGPDQRSADRDDPGVGGGSEPLVGRDRLTAIVVGIALLAFALRVVALGDRVAHWQEARLGWWIDHYARSGVFEANPVLGGSLPRILGRLAAGVVGLGDLAIRLPNAVVGGLLPLAALAFRRRLDGAEVVAAAGLLAVAPLLLYYGRFASPDGLAASLALASVAIVLAVRERPRRELVLAAAVAAVLTVAAAPAAGLAHLLALTLAWGAGLLATDPTGVGASETGTEHRDETGTEHRDESRASPVPAAMVETVRAAGPTAGFAAVVALAVLLDPGLPGALAGAITSPTALPGALAGPVVALVVHLDLALASLLAPAGLVAGGIDLLAVLLLAAPVLTGLAVVGGFGERWADRSVRPVVAVGLAWAVLGVPLQVLVAGAGTPWIATHVAVALVVPAAVGAVAIARWTRAGLGAGDPLTGATGLLAGVLVVGVLVAGVASGVYLAPTDPAAGPVQYGQPDQDLREAVTVLEDEARRNAGPDLVLYGDHFVDDARLGPPPRCARWHNALPLPWYGATTDADMVCTNAPDRLRTLVDRGALVVVGREGELGPIAERFENYTARTVQFRAWNANTTVLLRNGTG